MKSAYEDKEKLIGQLFMGGAVSFVAGLFLTGLGLFLGGLVILLGPLLALVGIGMGVFGFLLGFEHNKVMSSGFQRPQQEGRVIARFAINDIGEMIFDNYDEDAEDAKYYVRMQFLGGRREEFECARPVFDQCGEGMRGLVTLEGSWLSQFTALVDTEETRAAYKDW